MAPRDTWADSADALDRIRLLTSHGMTVPEIRANLAKAKVPAPLTAAGDRPKWTDALVSAGQEYLRRRAAAAPPAPSPGGAPATDEDLIARVISTVDRAVVEWAAMDPMEWERWIATANGKAAVRQINACAILLQARAALESGATASAPRIAEQLAKLTGSTEPGAPEQTDARATVTTAEEAARAVVEDLPTIVALVGRDAILRALLLREIHVEPIPAPG